MQLERIAWPAVAPIDETALSGQLEAEGFEVLRWSDAAGADYQPHSHDHDESLWVLDGEITFGAGGQTLRLAAGDRLMLPRGTVHTAQAGAAGATYLIGQKRAGR
ncbi:MAG: cupin domain-containing protein [Candidatus Binatia bacterium]